MSLVSIQDLTFSYDTAYDNIFENTNIQFDTDWKLGFIGRNGRGKTTLLRLLMGKYEYHGSIAASVSFDYFPYEVEQVQRNTREIIKEVIAPYAAWEKEMEECLETGQGTSEEDLNSVMARYGEIQELYQKHDGYIIDELIEKELGKLKVDLSVLEREFSTISFGERTKVMLAALFLKKNNYLLIDEPTNHLDMEGRDILSEYLRTKSGFLLVSHDRAFLDRCIDHVLVLNRSEIVVQKGNFSSWYQNKLQQDQYEINKNEQTKKEIAGLEAAVRRTTGWADQIEASKIGSHSGDRGFIGHMAANMMKRAKSIERRKLNAIQEKKELLKNIETADPLRMNVMEFHKNRLVEAEDLSLYYGERRIAREIEFQLFRGERLSIRGKNGSGKSTLFRLLLGEEIKHQGVLRCASGLNISYVSQDTSYLRGNLRDFVRQYGLDEAIFKTVLRQLDFSREQFDKDISEFSGGQKKKVLLAKSLAQPAHLFLWDEPLNFIDVFSRIQIEELILKFCPTMIFVEHDREFSEKIVTKEINLTNEE